MRKVSSYLSRLDSPVSGSRLNLSLGGKPQNLEKNLSVAATSEVAVPCKVAILIARFYMHSLRTGPSGEWYFCIIAMKYYILSRRSQDPGLDRGLIIYLRNRANCQAVTKLISVLREETKHRVCDHGFSFGYSQLCSSLIVRDREE